MTWLAPEEPSAQPHTREYDALAYDQSLSRMLVEGRWPAERRVLLHYADEFRQEFADQLDSSDPAALAAEAALLATLQTVRVLDHLEQYLTKHETLRNFIYENQAGGHTECQTTRS